MKVFTSPMGDIYLGSIHHGLQQVIHDHDPSSVICIVDENTSTLCLPELRDVVDTQRVICLPAGENTKNLESCRQIWSSLIQMEADRSALILNVGGGMICDLGGFAATCFQRGIRFAHIPTTVLAMADASIGGKTGINLEGYKNYVGRIQPPSFVWIDPLFIRTLPDQDIQDGIAEIVKHAIVGSSALWEVLERMKWIDMVDWNRIFEINTPVKQGIIDADPYEKGLRKILNFGHTIGHALESQFMGSTQALRHGQAVTLGMLAEARISFMSGLLDEKDFNAVAELIHRMLRPAEVTLPPVENLLHWMQADKKNSEGRIRFSLPDGIGSCMWNVEVPDPMISGSIQWLATQGMMPSDRLKVN